MFNFCRYIGDYCIALDMSARDFQLEAKVCLNLCVLSALASHWELLTIFVRLLIFNRLANSGLRNKRRSNMTRAKKRNFIFVSLQILIAENVFKKKAKIILQLDLMR